MSEDEFLAFIGSTVIAFFIWGRWLLVKLQLKKFSPGLSAEAVYLLFALILSNFLLFALLANYASHDVRDSGLYMAFYMVMGAALVGLGTWTLDLFGLSIRDDVIERRNPASTLAFAGAIPGLTLAYAGANIGDGPGWWVVVFCAGLSIGSLFLGWLVLDQLIQLGEIITVERNRAAGLRAGLWFIATGAIVGRAAAGNWISVDATLYDFGRISLGAVGLLGFAVALETWVRPRPGKPKDRLFVHGLIPGFILICLALLYLNHYGRW